MPSSPSNSLSFKSTFSGPLHFLAHTATQHMDASTPMTRFLTPLKSSPASSQSSYTPHSVSPTPKATASLHIPCAKFPVTSFAELTPLKCSNLTLRSHKSGALNLCRTTRAKKALKRRLPKNKLDSMHARRRDLKERALRIKTVENSPVNEQQLSVLRMVFNEITMYPSEAWMILIAIVIRRAFKQIKNWFSNERQKSRVGEVITTCTDIGDKLRLRPLAADLCDEWSDAFFEEVLMIHNYKTLRSHWWEESQNPGSTPSIAI